MALLADKVVGAEHVALCPTMDLVAIVTRDGALIVHRTMTWQKLLTVPTAEMSEMGGGPTAICWAPDGRVLVLGHATGAIVLHDVERGEPLPARGDAPGRRLVRHDRAIVSMVWSTQGGARLDASDELTDDVAEGLAHGYCERAEHLLPQAPPDDDEISHGAGWGGAEGAATTSGTSGGGGGLGPRPLWEVPGAIGSITGGTPVPLSLLVSADASGRVLMMLHGLYPVIAIELGPLNGVVPAAIHSMCVSGDLRTLLVWTTPAAAPATERAHVAASLAVQDISPLWSRRHQLGRCDVEATSAGRPSPPLHLAAPRACLRVPMRVGGPPSRITTSRRATDVQSHSWRAVPSSSARVR